MHIREAAQADLPFIVSANTALAGETEGRALDGALLGPGGQAVLDDPGLGRYYIAEIDGQAAGQLMTTYEWSDWRNGIFLGIESVYVQPAHRGIRLYVDRGNARARGVYARLGMHRSNYVIMKTVYRGPESHEEAQPC